ncbi:MAG TPA: hypothetical protein VD867_13830 [Burkholderiales bacterium]|nr:hypothetical protein [Burkholderiales bacterium]
MSARRATSSWYHVDLEGAARMQAPASSRTWFPCRWALLTAIACSAPATVVHLPRASAPTATKTVQWERFVEVSTWPTVTETSFPSQGHHTELPSARIRTSPEAREAYLALVQDSVLPEGSIVALFHESPDASKRGGVYAMQKTGGRWQYLRLDSLGRLQSPANAGECARCHADAAADHLFGLPRTRSARAVPGTAE